MDDKNQFFCRCSTGFPSLELLQNHSLDGRCYAGFHPYSVKSDDDASRKKEEIIDNDNGHNQMSIADNPSSRIAGSSNYAFNKPSQQVPHTGHNKWALPNQNVQSSTEAKISHHPSTLESSRKLFQSFSCLLC